MLKQLDKDFNYRWLLISILGLFTALPFQAYEGAISELLIKLCVTSIMLSAIHCSWKNKVATAILGVCMLPTLAATWFDSILLPDNSYILCNLFFYIIFIYFISTNILKTKEHSFNALAGALSAYLLIGLAFAYLYTYMVLKMPNAFNLPELSAGLKGAPEEDSLSYLFGTFIYHSFITLTTVGYGDVTPNSFPARFLCIFEAIIGQIYLVVVVSGFVGLFVSQKMIDQSNHKEKEEK